MYDMTFYTHYIWYNNLSNPKKSSSFCAPPFRSLFISCLLSGLQTNFHYTGNSYYWIIALHSTEIPYFVQKAIAS